MSVRMRLSWEPGGTVEVDQAVAQSETLQGWGRESDSLWRWSFPALRQTSS